MPDKTPVTKKQKQAAVGTVMREFKGGKLHSGSKAGPVVKPPGQAVAIALSESGQSKPKMGPDPNPQHEAREREVMGAGAVAHEAAEKASWGSTPAASSPHRFDRPSSKPSQGYGHPAPQRSGALRMSGHSGAHRVGKR